METLDIKTVNKYKGKTDNNEIWMQLFPDEEIYKISTYGRIINVNRNKLLKPKLGKCGYLRIGLYRHGKYTNILIHKYVALRFISNPENKPQVNHIDGNKQNPNINNLEWTTRSENMKHAYQTGLIKRYKGEDSHRSKISNEDRIEIVKRYKSGEFQKDICKEFGLSQSAVSYLVRNTVNYSKIKRNGVKIIALDLCGNVEGVFNSGIEAANNLGVKKWNISKVLKGQLKQINGFKFKYFKDYINERDYSTTNQ